MLEQKQQNLSDSVYARLEHDILCGEYKPNDILTESKLCINLGTSRTPVREALKRLQQEGLVVENARIFTVVGVTRGDIEDVYDIRMLLEGFAVERCVAKITDDGIKRLEEIVDLQEYYISKHLPEKSREKDSEFHNFIYGFSGSGIIPPLLEKLHRRVQFYRERSMSNEQRAVCMISEHRQIIDAVKKRDTETAKKLIELHIRNAKENILNNVLH